jgi:predicted DNA-binding protein
MTNSKLDNFAEKLDRDWAWRIREIVSHTLLLSNADSHQETLLAKLGVILLYSHWEGFVKNATKEYLLIFSRDDMKSVSPHVQAVFFLKHLQKNQYVNVDYKLAIESVERISRCDIVATREIKDVVNVKSNLNASVFKDLLSIVNVDDDFIELKSNYIDREFVGVRHAVAHGSHRVISKDGYTELKEVILKLIEMFKSFIVDSASRHIVT